MVMWRHAWSQRLMWVTGHGLGFVCDWLTFEIVSPLESSFDFPYFPPKGGFESHFEKHSCEDSGLGVPWSLRKPCRLFED